MTGVSRRWVLVGGGLTGAAAGAGWLVGEGVLPGRERVARALGWCGEPPVAPSGRVGVVRTGLLAGAFSGARVVVGWPPGVTPGAPASVVVLLHGGGGDARTPFDVYGIHKYLGGAVRRGVRPFAVASVDGRDGWTGAGADVVLDGLLPYLARQGLRTDRIALLGWSMGGDGALALASRLGARRISAVVATSPAITAESARAYAARLDGIPVWAGCGGSDGFAEATEELLTALRERGARPAGGIGEGCHDAAYRMRVLPRQLAFLGARAG